jgi:hypothetical protein
MPFLSDLVVARRMLPARTRVLRVKLQLFLGFPSAVRGHAASGAAASSGDAAVVSDEHKHVALFCTAQHYWR